MKPTNATRDRLNARFTPSARAAAWLLERECVGESTTAHLGRGSRP